MALIVVRKMMTSNRPGSWRWSPQDRVSAAIYWVERTNSGQVQIDELAKAYLIREYSEAPLTSHYGQIIDLLCELNQRLNSSGR